MTPFPLLETSFPAKVPLVFISSFCKLSLVVCDVNGSKGFGFVHYESDESAQQAIEKVNGMLMEDKKVFVARFKSRNDRMREFGDAAKVI